MTDEKLYVNHKDSTRTEIVCGAQSGWRSSGRSFGAFKKLLQAISSPPCPRSLRKGKCSVESDHYRFTIVKPSHF